MGTFIIKQSLQAKCRETTGISCWEWTDQQIFGLSNPKSEIEVRGLQTGTSFKSLIFKYFSRKGKMQKR
jgi:hypothetical protein